MDHAFWRVFPVAQRLQVLGIRDKQLLRGFLKTGVAITLRRVIA
jgi:hypothetical protein